MRSSAAPNTPISQPKGRINIRNTSGVIIGVGEFSHTSRSSVPSFRSHLDRFLDSFGFQEVTIWQIANAWEKSEEAVDFTAKMQKHGMGYTEAEWFWKELFWTGGVQSDRRRPAIERIIL